MSVLTIGKPRLHSEGYAVPLRDHTLTLWAAVYGASKEEALTRAAALAAAPDLLEAAELVLCGAAPETLRAAVAKAEGEAS